LSDVFISYSRKDTQFIREILELLGANKREAWIDLHDIDYSVKWWEEICAGIDGADNFVLFVSQSSVESLFVHREIEYALSHQKRIIPFLIKRVDEEAMFEAWRTSPDLSKYEQMTRANWKSIQDIQWIDYTLLNDASLAVETLLATVDIDPQRVKLHTRLLLRLRDWESQGQNPSGLLRGEELAQYEQWRTDTHQKGTPPHATEEQEVYIAESRRYQDAEEAKRLQRERLVRGFRMASMVLGGFFLLAVIATIFAIVFANNAVSAQQTAIAQKGESNTQVALGNTQVAIIGQTLTPIPPKLTAVAQTLVAGSSKIEALNLSAAANNILQTEGGNAETAALLSIRVLRKIYLASADSALVEATSRLRAVPLVFKVDDKVNGVTFSPDGKTFVIGYGFFDGGGAELIDTASGKVIWMVEPLPCMNSVDFSPDGKLIVLADEDHTARLLDAATGKTIRILREEVIIGENAVFSPDGKTVLVKGMSDSTVSLWNVETGQQIFSVPALGAAPFLFFDPNGQTFFASGNIYSASDGHQVPSNIKGGAGAISPDGKTYVSIAGMWAQLRDTSSDKVLQSLFGHTDQIWSAAFSKDSKMLVTGSKDNTARVWDVATGKLLLLLSGQNTLVSSVAFSPDGTKVLTGSSESNYVRLWDIKGGNLQQTFSAPAGISASALAPNGETLLVGDVDGNSSLWDINTGQELQNFRSCPGAIESLAYSPDGKLLAVPDCYQGNNLRFKLYDPLSGALLKTFSTTSPQPGIMSLTFSSDSKMIFASYRDSKSRLWDIASGQVLRLFHGNDTVNHVSAYSPDGKLVTNGVNMWWDISAGVMVEFPGATGDGSSIFSGDGSLIAIADTPGNVSVWKISTKQLINHFSAGHADRITSLAFSPDNKFLLTGSADKTARLWDISSGQLLRVFSGHSAAISSVAFSPDGKRIITTSLDKSVRTWITDYNDLVAYACSRLGRDFTSQERILYGIADQEPTCPQFGDQAQPLMPTTTPMPTRTPVAKWTPLATPTSDKP